ncbi:hypothetical protein LZ198_00435 [Myxococcus sp. K15C18031901]|uniref:hypothetical protein n=1 Tax=Myxococcus dinghuensis TaxID=2906761 RepID=UPI0020A79F12|nr:hypothetical protein [Myxococcus dinghuensis]MCP3097331.1 hypothetical protein [Myxococcus dinghuensis]
MEDLCDDHQHSDCRLDARARWTGNGLLYELPREDGLGRCKQFVDDVRLLRQ